MRCGPSQQRIIDPLRWTMRRKYATRYPAAPRVTLAWWYDHVASLRLRLMAANEIVNDEMINEAVTREVMRETI